MIGKIVFIPGFMQRADAWERTAAAVAESYPSTCLDFATHDFEGRVEEVLAACVAPRVAVGYSMGGRLALHAALRSPVSFEALVLVGVSAGIEDEAERTARRDADEKLAAWMEVATIEEVVERWERLPVFATQPPELVAAQRRGRSSHDPRALARLLRSAGQGALPPLWRRLPELSMPVAAMAGELDRRYADDARRIAAVAPRAEAVVIPGAGHAAHLERPEAFAAALLGFLDRAGVAS